MKEQGVICKRFLEIFVYFLFLTPFLTIAQELITNGDFSEGKKGWTLSTLVGAEGSLEIVDGMDGKKAAQISVTKATEKDWSVAINQKPLSIIDKKSYKLSLWAKAHKNIKLNVLMREIGNAQSSLGLKKEIEVTPEWQKFENEFVASKGSDIGVFLIAGMGKDLGNYSFASISIMAGDGIPSTTEASSASPVSQPSQTGTGLSTLPVGEAVKDNLIKNGDFSNGRSNWDLLVLGGAEAGMQVTEESGKHAMQVKVAKVGEKVWNVALVQKQISITAKQAYSVSVWAKGDKGSRLTIQLKAKKGQKESFRKDSVLTDQWQEFKTDFVGLETDENSVLQISGMGGAVGTSWFSNISLIPTQGVVRPEASNTPPATSQSKAPVPSLPRVDEFVGEKGKVTAVDQTAKTITIVNVKTKESEAFSINESTIITLNGSPAVIGSIKAGMNAAILPAADPLIAEKIALTSK